MISSIELKNWRTHEDTRLEFGVGVNLLVGVMGSGKSSVMDAISFALFGTFPALKRGSLKSDSIIMNRPKEMESSEVALEFAMDNDIYRVIRVIEAGKSSTATLLKNGELFQTQAERVNEEISRLLKIDYNIFSRAIYSEQNGLSYFLDITKSERKRQIDNMLGLDDFAKAEERITTIINSIKSLLKDEEQMLENIDIERMQDSYRRMETDLSSKRAELESMSKGLEGKRVDLKRIRGELESARKMYSEMIELTKERERLNSQIETLSVEMGRIRVTSGSRDEISKRLEGVSAEERGLKTDYNEITKRERALLAETAGLRSELNRREAELRERDTIRGELGKESIDHLKSELERTRSDMDERIKAMAITSQRLGDAREWIAELNRHISVCPLCEREIDSEMKERLIEGKRSAIERLEVELSRHERDIESLKIRECEISERYKMFDAMSAKLQTYGNIDDTVREIKTKLDKGSKELDSVSESRAGIENSIKKISDIMQELRSEMERLTRFEEMESLQRSAKAKLEGIAARISAIVIDEGMMRSLEDRYSKALAEVNGIGSSVEAMANYIHSMEVQLSSRKLEMDRMLGVRERITRRAGYVESLIKFKSSLGVTSSVLRSDLILSINELMAELWGEMYPYGDYPSIRLDAENDDYILEADVGRDGKRVWVPINGVASGGERSVACLVMRITMSMVIVPNLRWIILDEPTHNIDSNGIYKLVDVFGESLPNVMEQVFIITHDEALKQINNANVYLFERDKSSRSTTYVSKL
jgi:exonuclease SbcC